jgi:hypothetical protein
VRIRQLIQRASLCALLVGIFLLQGTINPSWGSVITVDGTNYSFSSDNWDGYFTSNPATTGLKYGLPQILGSDVLDFNNIQFSSVAGGSTPLNFVDGKLSFRVTAKDGQAIDGLTLSESGAYSFFSLGNDPTLQAIARFIPAKLSVISVDNVAIAPVDFVGHMSFTQPTPTTADQKVITPAANDVLGTWAGMVSFTNLASQMNLQPGQRITSVELTFDNQLITSAGSTSLAFIDKKEIRVGVIPPVVPEPASLLLLGMGGLVFALVLKCKK